MQGYILLELLARHPFTSELSDEQREALVSIALVKVYEPDELLIQEGRSATAFYLIVDGLVAIEMFLPSGGARRLQTVGAGSAVGWSWIVPFQRWEFDARALERTRAIVLDAERLRELFDREYYLGLHLLRKLLVVVAGRLTAARLQLLDVYGLPEEMGR
ncbi:MAG: cyclic nucleotide-binding domain-containing protein [Chloroflexi bacterium]|nr:cyclic nucleotide-binding domain-containing protein [Chloroflexota bacterium]